MTNYVKFWNEDEIPIVFDYTDVYESFGDITEADVSGWFKGKRFDEKFKVGFLELGIFLLDPNFGYETQGGASVQFADYIMGTPYTCPEAGTATSVSVYISVGATPCGKFKCAIYKVSDDSLVAYTEELEGISSFSDFKTLDIVWGGTLTATDYYLMWWTDDATNIAFWYSTDIAGAYDAETYDGFPATLNPTVYGSHKFSIYCTYTTDGGQEKTFGLSETCGISDSLDVGKEKGSSFDGNCGVESLTVVGKEKLIVFSPIIEIISEMSFSKELSIKIFELFETCNITEALTINKEKMIVLENPFTISSLLGMTKEQKLTLIEFFETVFIDSQLTISLPTEEEEGGASGRHLVPKPLVHIRNALVICVLIIIIYIYVYKTDEEKKPKPRKHKPTTKPRKHKDTLKPRKQRR